MSLPTLHALESIFNRLRLGAKALNELLDIKLPRLYNIFMDYISFSWDNRKNLKNQEKHKVSFAEAQSVFFDENAIEYFDADHSEVEDRYLMLGLSYKARILIVSYAWRKDATEIRIISSRKATKIEENTYWRRK